MSSFVDSKKRIERIKGMRNGNRAEELNGVLVIMEMPQSLPDDLLVEIITRLPLKFAVQGKVLNKNLNGRISDPKFSTQLICTSRSMGLFQNFHKISLNPIPTIGCEMNLPYDIELLDSCKGLILFDFEAIKSYCVFNPITRARQLIPYREPTTFMMISDPGLAVDYPSSNQYKLVTISKLARHSNLFDKFHVLSSDRSGLWREIQLRSNTFSDLAIVSGPVFWLNSLHWLRSDGSVLAFDTNREEAILIERPKFIDHCDFMYGKILTGCDKWLGVAQGLLTLVCIFKKSIIIAAYDNASSNWKVSHTGDNFVSGPYGFINGFPVLIDSERVFFLLERPLTIYHDVYEYDTEINGYRKTAKLHTRVDYPMYCFNPTLASVHETPSEIVDIHYFSYIAAKIDVFRRFITEGVSHREVVEEESSESEEEE